MKECHFNDRNKVILQCLTIFILAGTFVFPAAGNNQSKITDIILNDIVLSGVIRDFQASHPDFEHDILSDVTGWNQGSVLDELDEDGKPVFNPDSGVPSIESVESFAQWFRDVDGVNQSAPFEIVLKRGFLSSSSIPVYTFKNDSFFPIDRLLWGNEGRIHNYHFTYELHAEFTYEGPQDLIFISDDDLFVFINNHLVVDLGGVHRRTEQIINTGVIGLDIGETYPLDLFFAERHITESFLKFQTGLVTQSSGPSIPPVASRSFSQSYYDKNDKIQVTLDVINSSDEKQNWRIAELLPEGWTAKNASNGGLISGNSILWEVSFEPGTTQISYTAVAPGTVDGVAEWGGAIESEVIRGDDQLNALYPGIGGFDGHLDIGKPGAEGGASIVGAQLSVIGSGQDIGNSADHCHFIYKVVWGDFKIEIKRPYVMPYGDNPTSSPLARMGIMARQSLEPSSAFVFANIRSFDQALGMQWRHKDGAEADYDEKLGASRIFDRQQTLCMRRVGDCFIVTLIEPSGEENIHYVHSVPMEDPLYLGVAVTSNETGAMAVGLFEDPYLGPLISESVYSEDFEDGAGSEWSNQSVEHTPIGDRAFLGQFGNDTVSLKLNNLPEHTDILVCFDLFAIRSLDGNNSYEGLGPDLWDLYVPGGVAADTAAAAVSSDLYSVLHTTFSNDHGRYVNSYHEEEHDEFPQAYPRNHPEGEFPGRWNAAENNTLGYFFNEEPMDSVYRLGERIPHQGDSIVINFAGSGMQGLADESWGLDNVTIYAIYAQGQQIPPTPIPTETPTETPTVVPTLEPTAVPVSRIYGTIRDFKDTHPDFESFTGSNPETGIVKFQLGNDGKPVFNTLIEHQTVSNKQNFDQWFNDVNGINLSKRHIINFYLDPSSTNANPVYLCEMDEFFPIDDELFGNQERDHNFHFTYELHAKFKYTQPAMLEVSSDDDMWVFINNLLVIDLGGAHPIQTKSINLEDLGLNANQYITLDIYYAERHTTNARFKIRSGVKLLQNTLPDPTEVPTKTPVPTKTKIPTKTPRPTKTIVPTETPTYIPTPTPTKIPTKTPVPTEPPTTDFILGGGTFNGYGASSFMIPIRVENMPETKAITFDLQFNQSVLAFEGFSKDDTLLSKWPLVDANHYTGGKIRVTAAALSSDAAAGDGTLIFLEFSFNTDSGLGGKTTLKFSNLMDGVKDAISKAVTIILGMKGDVDGNGRITANDAQLAFLISALRMEPTPYQEWAAEVTGDGLITAGDAQRIFEASLGKVQLEGLSGKKMANSSGRSGRLFAVPGTLTVGNVTGAPGEEVVVPINLDNQTEIDALLFDVSYDAAKLAFQGVKTEGTLVEGFANADGYEAVPGSGSVRVSAAAFMADPITASGELIALRFLVKEGVSGIAAIAIEMPDDDLYGASVVDGAVTINSTAIPESYVDEVIIGQGLGGQNLVNVRNFDPAVGPVTSVLNSFGVLAGGRATYLSSGDVDGDGDVDVVLSFGPVMEPEEFPNLVVVRDANTREVIGHSFEAFPSGVGADVNYNGGEVRTAVGDFIGAGIPQIAAAQGYGGNGIVRLYQYTGLPAPFGWEVVGQFNGLAGPALSKNANGGVALAAADLDGDGLDELIVGQTNSPTSQTICHVIDIDSLGRAASRLAFVAFQGKYQGNGGVELTTADLDGDGWKEIIAASQGNNRQHGDDRDGTPLNLIAVIQVNVINQQVQGFYRPMRNILNVFNETLNPSGAISVTGAELNGNPLDGQELVIGTGSLIQVDGMNVTPVKPAPQSRYRIIKLNFDGQQVDGLQNVYGAAAGFQAFLDELNPTSGAVFVTAAELDS